MHAAQLRRSLSFRWLLAMFLVAACASSEVGEDNTGIGSSGSGGSGAADNPAEEEEEEDAGCSFGSHMCGATCTPDTSNTPDVGCRYGCGEACPDAANGSATCTETGICDVTCDAGYSKVGGECVAFSCSTVDFVCGNYVDEAGTTFDCGSCFGTTPCGSDHTCTIKPDAKESNDSQATAKDLGTFNDQDNDSKWIDGLTIDDDTDEDWFKFRVQDGFDGSNPDVRVKLARHSTDLGWLSSAHELTVWFKCDTSDDTSLTCGVWYTDHGTNNANSSTMGKGCRVYGKYVPYVEFEPNCGGTTDSGTAYIRIRKLYPPKGDTYDLYVHAQ